MKPGQLVEARFEIVRLAGSGGMGAVYLARDAASGDHVALKVLHVRGEQHAARFAREAEVLSELRHPGIVRYVGHGRTADGELWLAMEWLEGEDLAARLDRSRMTVGESVGLVLRAARALAEAHARGVVHRDIKPSNLFLSGRDLERVKLLDFGIARHRQVGPVTGTGMTLGTPGYMAPEQARGERDVDARADVFSLGCVLFECITGNPVFSGDNVMALLAKILLDDPPRLRDVGARVPPALDDLVARMLAKARAERPRDAGETADELASLGAIRDEQDEHEERGERTEVIEVVPSITAGEQRLLSVVLAAPRFPVSLGIAESAPTLSLGAQGELVDRLRQVIEEHGGRLETLSNGSFAATVTGNAVATDLTMRAARCALAMRALLPEMRIALATGRGLILVGDRLPAGEVIDRAVRLLDAARAAPEGGPRSQRLAPAPPGAAPIRVDDVTAGLLDARFVLGGDALGLDLRGERELVEVTRSLLGRPTPCVGRENDLRVLEAFFEACADEPRAGALLVTAAAGIGKSRLRHEFLSKLKARKERVEVWLARGDPMSAGSPFGMVASAIRRAAGILDGEPLPIRRTKLRARVSRHVAAGELGRVTEFLGELIASPVADGSVQLRAARQDAILMGDQMRRAWEDFLAAECAAQPVVLVLEDLHWGDLPSVKCIDSALRNLNESPWMVLALARPEVRELFPELWRDRTLQQIRLSDLSRKGSARLVRQILGEDVPEAQVERLVTRAGGNAFYLEELLRAVVEGKGDALPETVLAMAQARLEALDGAARRVLRAASLFGQVFWEGGVEALLGAAGGEPTEIREWLGYLVDREAIGRRNDGKFPGEQEYVFRHALLREAAYAMLTDADRTLGHRLAGSWLEGAGGVEAVVLAEHFERGGEPARAIVWYRRAAEQALEGGDFAAAIALADRAVVCGAEGEALGAMRGLQSEAHCWRGEMVPAEQRGLEAMRSLPRGSPAWCSAAAEVALACLELYRRDVLTALFDELDSLPSGGRVEEWHAVAFARIACNLFAGGWRPQAETLLARAERIHPPSGAASADQERANPIALGWIHHARSWRAHYLREPMAAVQHEEAAVRCFELTGDRRNVCHIRVGLAQAYNELGAHGRAEETLRDVLEMAERMALDRICLSANHSLTLALSRLGKLTEAHAAAMVSLKGFTLTGNRRMHAGTRNYLAQILRCTGDLDGAAIEANASADMAAAASPEDHAHALATLASVELARGRVAAALEAARKAIELLDKLGAIEEGESSVRLTYAEALDAAGHHEEARAAIGAAREHLLARAKRIGDAEWRRTFLSAEENQRTLAIARAWGIEIDDPSGAG